MPFSDRKPITIGLAIAVGLLWVNGPVLPLMLGVPFLALFSVAAWKQTADFSDTFVTAMLIFAFGLGFIVAWLWWALMVPKWRLWAYRRVTDISKLKRWAIAVGLIWPDGHIFERTEIKSKAHAARERELEALKR